MACIHNALPSRVQKERTEERTSNRIAQRNAAEETTAKEPVDQSASAREIQTTSPEHPPDEDCALSSDPATPAPALKDPSPPTPRPKGVTATPVRSN